MDIRLPADAADILFVAQVVAAPRDQLLGLIRAVSDELADCGPVRREELLAVLQFAQDALYRCSGAKPAALNGAFPGGGPRLVGA